MRTILLVLLITLSSISYGQTYADNASKEKIESMEGNIYRMNSASQEEGYDGIGYVTTYSNPFYTGYFTIKDGMIYKCSRKGVIKELMFNEQIYATDSYLGCKVGLIREIDKYKKYLFHIKRQQK